MVNVEYVEGSKFMVKAREHEVICDQPIPTGDNSGMGPVELFLGALGSCAGFYAKEFLATRHIEAAGLKISVTAERSPQPPVRIEHVHIDIQVPSAVDPKYHDAVKRAAATCFLFRSMPEPVRMTTEVRALS